MFSLAVRSLVQSGSLKVSVASPFGSRAKLQSEEG
jgi:hypothetical protein